MNAIVEKPNIDFKNVWKNVTDICLPGEVWKDVEKYDVYDRGVYQHTYYFNKGDYQESNYGRTRSLRFGKIKIMSLCIHSDGYLDVCLYDIKSNKRRVRVSRLVATLFIPNPDNLPTVNHIIEANKTDNSIFNLEWASYKQQIAHGTCKVRSAAKCKRKVVQLSLAGDVLNIFNSATDASLATGVFRQGIANCCNGRCKTAGKYQWRYENEDERNVLMYSAEGIFLQEFNGVLEAARLLNIHYANISNCLYKKKKTAGGYQWRWKSDCPNYENIDPVKDNKPIKSVCRFELDGTYCETYLSVNDAALAVNGNANNISSCLKGRFKSAYGFQWRYESDCFNHENIDPVVYEKCGRKKKSQYAEKEGQFVFAGYFA